MIGANFIFKKREVILDCFTDRDYVFDYAPIKKAISFIPDWWRELPKSKVTIDQRYPDLNMRYCPGIIDFYKYGFIIPMWTELKLVVGPVGTSSYEWQYADEVSTIEVHNSRQWGNFLDSSVYQHFKLGVPWVLKSNKEINFSFTYPTWNFKKPEELVIFNAVDNYYYQNSTSINLVVKREAQVKQILIAHNQPLVHLNPLSDKKVTLKLHLVSSEEKQKIEHKQQRRLFFVKNYINKKLLRKNLK
jgi:hypothetical protein